MNEEKKRLEKDRTRKAYFRKWGPYLSEREWGTVREDFSQDGDAWKAFTFKESHSRAYMYGEDGIAGISDNHQRLCFSFAFWNGVDPFLKEKMFGLANHEGNHGEDLKELYYYLDNTPTHSYMKYLYKYPQGAFPYENLLSENLKRSQADREYELVDTGIFNQHRYFDCLIEYAKVSDEDLFGAITITNRGDETKELHVLSQLWFRNDWEQNEKDTFRPSIKKIGETKDYVEYESFHKTLGSYYFYAQKPDEMLMTENETNPQVYGDMQAKGFFKDAFHRYLIHHEKEAVRSNLTGTKSACVYRVRLEPKAEKKLIFRLSKDRQKNPLKEALMIINRRKKEADSFYQDLFPKNLSDDCKNIMRQAAAGLMWNKQYYLYVIEDWFTKTPPFLPQFKRNHPRNQDWRHVHIDDVLSVPDKWEFPALFAWDLAFHGLMFAVLDPEFAKKQMILLTREWYMHPNGQFPASEWNFDDVNPPVHAWATWRIYKIESKYFERKDRHFLETVFQKLLLNFTWWVNREDMQGRNVFKGGFLGLDNVSIFNRSEHLPTGGDLYQADATSWMGMYCLNMLTIAFELGKENSAYEDMASKFYEHFLYIADAINYESEHTTPLWCDNDGFYYDVLKLPDGSSKHLKVKSLVGLLPLLAVTTIEKENFDRFQGFHARMNWFLEHRSDLCKKLACMKTPGVKGRRILSIVNRNKLSRILKVMLDEKEFLSPFGIRSLSKAHENPYRLNVDHHEYCVAYEPGESSTRLFGGNSNWRGPIWIPINYLLIESLQKYYHYFGNDFKIECPTGSGQMMNLWEISAEISRRLLKIFKKDKEGHRPIFGGSALLQEDPEFNSNILFHEYFHAETGEGLGAAHQTGWTALIAKLIRQLAEYNEMEA